MKITVSLLLLTLVSCTVSRDRTTKPEIQVVKIWDEAPHNAFTDIIKFKEAYYVSLREGAAHVAITDGKARILRSNDGKKWQSVALLEKKGVDLRDQKLSITPKERLMVTIGGSVYDSVDRKKLLGMYPHVSFSDESGSNFSTPELALLDTSLPQANNWIWRVTWNKGIGYGIDYGRGFLSLVQTTDGLHFNKVSNLMISDYPNESTIRFYKNDSMFVLVRRDAGDYHGILAKSAPPYNNWHYDSISIRLGGPNFLIYNNHLIIGTRLYAPEGPSTAIVITDLNGIILKTINLPSKGDNSYPGMLIDDGKLWFTYYSSHEGKTSIYLAKIDLSELNS